MSLKLITKALPLLAGAVLALPAAANQQVWEFNQHTSPLNNHNFGNSINLNEDGINLNVSGWSDTVGPSNSPPEGLEETKLIYYGNSLGMQNADEDAGSPNHSTDSYDPTHNPSWGNDFDAALLSYDASVVLEHVGLAWAKEDYNTSNEANHADISVLAYTGAAPFSGFTSSDTWAGILSKGWSVIDNYSNVAAYSYTAVNSAAVSSKYWLISAFNPVFGNSHWSAHNDGFKLAGAKTSTGHPPPPPPGVPAPGTAALLLLGLAVLRKGTIGKAKMA